MASKSPWLALAVGFAAILVLMMAFAALFFIRSGDAMILMFGFMAVFWLAYLALVIGSAIHVLVRDDLTGVQRIVWLIIVIFAVPGLPVGAIVYLALGKERTRTLFADLRVPAGPQQGSPPAPPPE